MLIIPSGTKETAMQTIKNKIAQINEETRLFKEALKVKINALPDNPRIKRINNNPNCFIISSGDIFGNKRKKVKYKTAKQIEKAALTGKTGDYTPSNNLSAEYHDFKIQYEVLCELIDKTEFVKLPDVLEQLIKEKQLVKPNQHTIKFHPDVIKALDKTLKENF